MALAIAGIVAGLAGAGAGIYGASQGAAAQGAANRNNAQAIAENRRTNTFNATVDILNNMRNAHQQAIDNQRYDEAKRIEDAQRALVNRIATATQIDADGNQVRFDPLTGTWRTIQSGVGAANADRRRTLNSQQYTQALDASTIGGMNARDQRVQGGIAQSAERALGAELLNRYRTHQGRSTQQLEGAGIERNVAQVTDPLARQGEMAMLAGYRQGNTGNDALLGALARQGQGGTRAAIANARYDAPLASLNERDASAKSLLGPANTEISRGLAPPGTPAPQFSGDTSSNLMASVNRGNPAGVGTTLNPRNTTQAPTNFRQGLAQGFQPLNASGNMMAGVNESLQSILRNPAVKNWLGGREDQPPVNTTNYQNYNDFMPAANGVYTGGPGG